MININSKVKDVLSESKTIAMIGCSPDEYRTSNYAAKFLQSRGYKVIPVNPEADQVIGEKCYPKLTDIPDSITIDIVNVFRNAKFSADAVKDVAEWKSKTGQNPVVWTQLDVSSPEAEEIAEENDLSYIRNRCIMVEWERVIGN